jgi:hypothetical protein
MTPFSHRSVRTARRFCPGWDVLSVLTGTAGLRAPVDPWARGDCPAHTASVAAALADRWIGHAVASRLYGSSDVPAHTAQRAEVVRLSQRKAGGMLRGPVPARPDFVSCRSAALIASAYGGSRGFRWPGYAISIEPGALLCARSEHDQVELTLDDGVQSAGTA